MNYQCEHCDLIFGADEAGEGHDLDMLDGHAVEYLFACCPACGSDEIFETAACADCALARLHDEGALCHAHHAEAMEDDR